MTVSIPATPPIVVPKKRVTRIGGKGGEVVARRMTSDVEVQGRADLQWMLRRITLVETSQQIKLGNPPSNITVDGRETKQFDDAKRRVVVVYGTRLAAAAMKLVETTLKRNIVRATQTRTGKLADVSGSWRWKLITPQGVRVWTVGRELPPFTRGHMLVLEPFGVPYATRVNALVIRGGRLLQRKRPRLRKGTEGPPKPKQPVGFLRATAEAVRARAEFRDFAVTVVFSQQFKVPGEVSRKQGTGSIVIKLKRRVR